MRCNSSLAVLSVAVVAVAFVSSVCVASPPVTEPVDANVLNFPDVQKVEGTVSVRNFPQHHAIPFARSCVAYDETCSIDLTDLTELGEVHIRQASGQALDVGNTASPRFFNGGSTEVLLPPTVNSPDTGTARDVLFSQSMDLIPVDSVITFLEPDSSNVYCYISGYVVTTTAPVPPAVVDREEVPRAVSP